jgi:hypothetical protein
MIENILLAKLHLFLLKAEHFMCEGEWYNIIVFQI